jgi:hypothetical protein
MALKEMARPASGLSVHMGVATERKGMHPTFVLPAHMKAAKALTEMALVNQTETSLKLKVWHQQKVASEEDFPQRDICQMFVDFALTPTFVLQNEYFRVSAQLIRNVNRGFYSRPIHCHNVGMSYSIPLSAQTKLSLPLALLTAPVYGHLTMWSFMRLFSLQGLLEHNPVPTCLRVLQKILFFP